MEVVAGIDTRISLPPTSWTVATSLVLPVFTLFSACRGASPSRSQVWKPPVEAPPSLLMSKGCDSDWSSTAADSQGWVARATKAAVKARGFRPMVAGNSSSGKVAWQGNNGHVAARESMSPFIMDNRAMGGRTLMATESSSFGHSSRRPGCARESSGVLYGPSISTLKTARYTNIEPDRSQYMASSDRRLL
ncbi:hypothetical protein HYQ46_003908 [Verticillium longisporum]|nr:hypothetical protein HYQ46_003908 [Verticillium longisporum]